MGHLKEMTKMHYPTNDPTQETVSFTILECTYCQFAHVTKNEEETCTDCGAEMTDAFDKYIDSYLQDGFDEW